MKARSSSDFWAGLIYMAFGVTALVAARDYGMGSATRMGPGYFPTMLAWLLTAIGAVSALRGMRGKGEHVGGFSLRGILFIAGPIVLFATLLQGAGLLIALPLLIITSAYASAHFNWLRTLLLAAGLTVFCSLIFIKGLGIPMPLLGSWFGN
ncbi:MAG: tripartite tricarboxylate transporter TctB family protein [Rhodocyclaceae bacterium]|nr:tripartite tricarboxylate transporter TctB family protein [Rhodocyclaceae bacterium]